MMNLSDILLLKRLGLGILSFTGFLAFVLGGWILLSAVGSEPEAEGRNLSIVKPIAERTPSSVLSAVEPKALKLETSVNKVQTVTLGCLRDGAHVELKSVANQIRLKSRLCAGYAAEIASSSIVNRANGFEATLFNLENGGFTSDYISLVEGTNNLLLKIDNGDGVRAVAEVTILRSRGL